MGNGTGDRDRSINERSVKLLRRGTPTRVLRLGRSLRPKQDFIVRIHGSFRSLARHDWQSDC